MNLKTLSFRRSWHAAVLAAAAFGLVAITAGAFVAPLVFEPRQVSALPRPVADLGPLGRTEVVEPESVDDLRLAFAATSYQLSSVREGEIAVPRLYVTALPEDLPELKDVKLRKSTFLRALLPLVLLANEEIRSTRARVEALLEKKAAGEAWSVEERAWMAAVADYYEIEEPTREEFLNRVDEIPVSLALAQGIVESGWGTSRFAREGQALFGERHFGGGGIAARADSSARVRDFLDLMESVRAYMHNLNTHRAYDELRDQRAAARAAGEAPRGVDLATTLTDYAEVENYPQKLRAIIRQNRLDAFNRARLATGAVAERAPMIGEVLPSEG